MEKRRLEEGGISGIGEVKGEGEDEIDMNRHCKYLLIF